MAEALDSSYVVCWRERPARFTHAADWSEAREIFEARALASGQRLDGHRRSYGLLTRPGAGIEAGALAVYRGVRVDANARIDPDAFLLVEARPRIAVLGPRLILDGYVARLAPQGVRSELFVAAADDQVMPPKQSPPTEAETSLRAHQAAQALARGTRGLDEVRAELSIAELIYVGYELRRAKQPALARRIAEVLLREGVTPGRLNLLGAALRSLGFFDASVRAYEDSIAKCDLADRNPYAFVGLAATLRRLGRQDEGYDLVKRARRFYPEDRYVVETLDAILRDLRIDRRVQLTAVA